MLPYHTRHIIIFLGSLIQFSIFYVWILNATNFTEVFQGGVYVSWQFGVHFHSKQIGEEIVLSLFQFLFWYIINTLKNIRYTFVYLLDKSRTSSCVTPWENICVRLLYLYLWILISTGLWFCVMCIPHKHHVNPPPNQWPNVKYQTGPYPS